MFAVSTAVWSRAATRSPTSGTSDRGYTSHLEYHEQYLQTYSDHSVYRLSRQWFVSEFFITN